MATFKFGSNIFSAVNDFTLIGEGESGNLIIGGFGPSPKSPLVWIKFKNGGAFLNADLKDVDGEIVLQIRDNVITLNKENIYKVEQYPENQIPPDRIVVINQYGETAMDLQREGGIWNFNGDFYHGSWHVVATSDGTVINPRFPHV